MKMLSAKSASDANRPYNSKFVRVAIGRNGCVQQRK